VLSTKPYLIRALWSWCCDAGFTPYVTLFVDEQCQVPMDFVREGTITLNLSPAATGQLDIGNEWVTMNARFGGVPRELIFPISAVIGIYARENGAGMEFEYEPPAVTDAPMSIHLPDQPTLSAVETSSDSRQSTAPSPEKPGRPHLQRIK
jgi:stringent starvation protein B